MQENNKETGSGGSKAILAWVIFTLILAGYMLFEFSKLRVQQARNEQMINHLQAEGRNWFDQFERNQQSNTRERDALLTLQQDILQTREQIAALKGDQGWLLSKVDYLVFLANERLQAAQDVGTAIIQFKNADTLLSKYADPALSELKIAVSEDLASLEKIKLIDKQALWDEVRLTSQQLSTLSLKILGEVPVPPKEKCNGPSWQQALQTSWEEFKSLIKVTRLENNPIPITLGIREQEQIKYGLQLLIEQAQWAILQGNNVIFQEAIDKLKNAVDVFYAPTPDQQAVLTRLDTLKQQTVAIPLPSITKTLDVLARASLQTRGG